MYSTANASISKLIALNKYKTSPQEVQAKAIKYIYDVYYNLALENLLGVELENKNRLFASAIDIEKLALIAATARTITADTDKNGKVSSGSKRAKIQAYVNTLYLTTAQKYLVMAYLGYKSANGAAQVKAYINSLKLSKSQKESLYEMSGYKMEKSRAA